MMEKLAFVFPGQGSQSVGMLAEHIDSPVVQQTFAEASDVLGFDLLEMVKAGPAEALNRTENTQPALLTSSVALWRLWKEQSGGRQPFAMAGHSLGEYSALVCAGALSFKDAVQIVHLRGQFMQEAVPQGVGAMAAVLGLDDDVVRRVCADAAGDDVVEAVNYNSPGQVVIAGHAQAVERAVERAKEAGAKRALPLPVSVPSHCALMKPAAERLSKALESIEFKAPRIPVICNVTADICSDPEQIRKNLVEQLYNPVRWVESIHHIHESGVSRFVECGPGKVLAGLNKRIVRRVPVVTLESAAGLSELLDSTE